MKIKINRLEKKLSELKPGERFYKDENNVWIKTADVDIETGKIVCINAEDWLVYEFDESSNVFVDARKEGIEISEMPAFRLFVRDEKLYVKTPDRIFMRGNQVNAIEIVSEGCGSFVSFKEDVDVCPVDEIEVWL